jgi:AraC-like DNA-binding protein
VVVILSFGETWTIDGQRLESFAGGLRDRQVTTRHEGRSFGIHVDLVPPAAHRLFGVPLDELAYSQVALEDVLDEPFLAERLAAAPSWQSRFRVLDEVFARRASPPTEVDRAWRAIVASGGATRVGDLAQALGWSRKRLAARFREQVGVPAKTLTRIARFDRARRLADRSQPPDWARIALEAGYYDQSHLIREFRAFTDRTPETFFQDSLVAAA